MSRYLFIVRGRHYSHILNIVDQTSIMPGKYACRKRPSLGTRHLAGPNNTPTHPGLRVQTTRTWCDSSPRARTHTKPAPTRDDNRKQGTTRPRHARLTNARTHAFSPYPQGYRKLHCTARTSACRPSVWVVIQAVGGLPFGLGGVVGGLPFGVKGGSMGYTGYPLLGGTGTFR